MKINGNNDIQVKLISQGKAKAEVIVSQAGPDGSIVRQTRHLKLIGGSWKDRHGNSYSM